MKCVARFEKVSLKQYTMDLLNTLTATNEEIENVLALVNGADTSDIAEKYVNLYNFIVNIYNNIKVPRRSTKGSAGYDFYMPFALDLFPDQVSVIPTGIRCIIDEGYRLSIYPRSGLGFKYRVRLSNTVGIIDQDYYKSDNEGHILVKLSNETHNNAKVELKAGDRFCQGIFDEYFITHDDDVSEERNGGFGSTGN